MEMTTQMHSIQDPSSLPRSVQLSSVPREVVALAEELPKGSSDPAHKHERAQLLYASEGVMSVVTDEGSYVIPPQRALWLPPGMAHRVTCRTDVSLRTVYVRGSEDLPQHCRVIEVSPLLRALIFEAMTLPLEYRVDGREGRIMQLIVDTISLMNTPPLSVPMPSDRRLRRICQMILQNPARKEALDDWAALACVSRRTLTRQFREETGMSLANWRQHVRLIEAVARLSSGQLVSTVAYDVGYDTPSAFTAAFHRAFGAAPSRYAI